MTMKYKNVIQGKSVFLYVVLFIGPLIIFTKFVKKNAVTKLRVLDDRSLQLNRTLISLYSCF